MCSKFLFLSLCATGFCLHAMERPSAAQPSTDRSSTARLSAEQPSATYASDRVRGIVVQAMDDFLKALESKDSTAAVAALRDQVVINSFDVAIEACKIGERYAHASEADQAALRPALEEQKRSLRVCVLMAKLSLLAGQLAARREQKKHS